MKTIKKNRFIIILTALTFLCAENIYAQSKTINVGHFDKVIVSPHIQVTFVEGNDESVSIENISVPIEKLNVEVVGNTLRMYLEDAKMVTKSERIDNDKWKGKQSVYKGTVVTAIVTYKNLEELSLRGEERIVCESLLQMKKFRLKIYGESQVIINEVDLELLQTTIYGESFLEIKKGTIDKQKITAYGETKVNTLEVSSATTKITTYGEGSYRVNVSENLKVTAYGKATIAYIGNPNVSKGIIIGETIIQKI